MIYCPFCDGQGIIYKAKVKEKDIEIYICDECDTIWETRDFDEGNCERFDVFMNSLGYKGLWSELTDLEKLE